MIINNEESQRLEKSINYINENNDMSNNDTGDEQIEEVNFSLEFSDLSLNINEEREIEYTVQFDDEVSQKKYEASGVSSLLLGSIEYEIEDNSIVKIEGDKIIGVQIGTTVIKATYYHEINRCRLKKCITIKQDETTFSITVN